MKKQDWWVIIGACLVLCPFFFMDGVKAFYFEANAKMPVLAGFVKFAVLSTFGEVIALRLRTGHYYEKGFGLWPRMIVWGFLGAWIVMAMRIFGKGVPVLCDGIFCTDGAVAAAMQGGLSWTKFGGAFAISLMQNTAFAPVFMLLHKVSDTHILEQGGRLKALVTPVPFSRILANLNWDVQWNFVFKKTIPLFWIPAHTVTFMLPPQWQVLFAALLGVILGVLLAIAANKK